MSARNGGRGTPPIPPPEALPQQQEIPIEVEITRRSRGTTAERQDEGVSISFIVVNSGQPEQHTYLVGEPGKKAILDALTGGLALADHLGPGLDKLPSGGEGI